MHKFFKIFGILAGLGVLAVIAVIAPIPWTDWGITKDHTEGLAEMGETPEVSYPQTAGLQAFGQNISVSYEPCLAMSIETSTVPAVLPDNQSLFSDWHPIYAQISFLGFPADNAYQLPFIDPEITFHGSWYSKRRIFPALVTKIHKVSLINFSL